jgi:glucose dehydrogenase
MKIRRTRAALGMLLAIVVATASAAGASGGAKGRPDPVPAEVADHAGDWPLPHHDYSNSRASASSAGITVANVATLKPAWTLPLPGRGLFGNYASTPLIVGSTAYAQDLESNVFALDVRTGTTIWEAQFDRPVIGPNGVGIGYHLVYAVVGRGTVVALDAATGKKRWSRSLTKTKDDGIDIQPTVYDGLVLVSTVPASIKNQVFAPNERGVLFALNAHSGKVVWHFDTVKGNLWGHPEVNAGGGSWFPPAIDTKRAITYWGTGNPAPWAGTADFPSGSSRPGPNLYTDSVLAIGLHDGKLKWYRQAKPHDLFDHDLQHTLLAVGASGRELVIASGKGGTVFAYDARSGAPVWHLDVGQHQNDRLKKITGNTFVAPGPLGGVETPMAYADQTVFVPTVNNPATYLPRRSNFVLDFNPDAGTGEIDAIDTTSGALRWKHAFPKPIFSGATVVNDLVFAATSDGVLYGMSRATGAVLFTWNAPGGINGFPSAAGDTLLVPVGLSDPAVLVALRPGG